VLLLVTDKPLDVAAFAQLEDQLAALGERWAHVCRWAELRGTRLEAVAARWEDLKREQEALRQWLNERETHLKHMEANPSVALGELAQRVNQLKVKIIVFFNDHSTGA
jgi:hypothetical protein